MPNLNQQPIGENPSVIIAALEEVAMERFKLAEAGSKTPSSPAKIRAAAQSFVRGNLANASLVGWYDRWKRDHDTKPTTAELDGVAHILLAELMPTAREKGRVMRIVKDRGIERSQALHLVLAERGTSKRREMPEPAVRP